ncbi:MAG: ABC transporter permease [Oscillospiraceae bacterium]|nr:ABC transporter permease [Oscillospiraceae bacterium]
MIAIYRENADIGIFKSTGFTSRQLRAQFALRFLLVSLLGGFFGILLNLIASSVLLSFIFGIFGVPQVGLQFNALELLFPVALVCLIALVAAWLVSARIRRVSGRVLIAE